MGIKDFLGLGSYKAANETWTTTTAIPLTSVNSTDVETAEYQPVGEATIPVLVCIIVVILIVGVSVFIYLRVRRRRLAFSRRESQLRVSTTNHAGVYVDLSPSTEHDLFTAKQRPPRHVENQSLRKNSLD